MPFSYGSHGDLGRVPGSGVGRLEAASFPCNANPQGGARNELIRAAGAALLALSFATGSAPAMPQAPAPEGDGLVTRVQIDCHQDVRRHYCPNMAARSGTATARTAGSSSSTGKTTVTIVRGIATRDVRRHYLPEYGRSVLPASMSASGAASGSTIPIRAAVRPARIASGSARSRSAKTSAGPISAGGSRMGPPQRRGCGISFCLPVA